MNNYYDAMAIVRALIGHVRVNESNKTVEIYNEYGTKMVLRDLNDETFNAFVDQYGAN
jgi:hypothetical protein